MVDVVVKEVDPQGRVSIPISWRKEWKSRKLVLIKRRNRIELIPMEPISPLELFDSIDISENVDFSDPHSLKKALLELREH
ncbi:MAG: AbrB family transcriptional regulator [Nitrososphaerales archaeon]